MKYKLKFVTECNREYLWYKDEVKLLMTKHRMLDVYYSKIEPVNQYRWWPSEIFRCLEKEVQ